MAKALVAFFSATGTTKTVATKLANAIGAVSFEIVPEIPYTTADLDWQDAHSRSSQEMDDVTSRPKISSVVEDMAQYDLVFVGFPVWWYREPSIIDTFMEAYDFRDKLIVPFATSGTSPIGDAGKNMQRLAAGAQVLVGQRFEADVSADELARWARQWL